MMLKTPAEIVLFTLLIALVTYICVKGVGLPLSMAQPMPMQMQRQMQMHSPVQPIIIQQGGDDRYTRAPRPQRMWDAPLEIPSQRSPLDAIATRGPSEEYQQMGVLTSHDGKVLPLYGRRVAPRSDFFNYYTRTDTYNPVALPIRIGKRDCQDSVGCSEVFTGDTIKMDATGESAKVTLYGF